MEIRPRSGVYLAPQETVGRTEGDRPIVTETVGWLGGVLYQAHQRGMAPGDLVDVLARVARPSAASVICFETVRDPLEALASAVEETLAVECGRILVRGKVDPAVVGGPEGPDFAVTTVYHNEIRKRLGEVGVPVVLLRINPEWVASLRRFARESGLVIVVADPGVSSRFADLLGGDVPVDCVNVERVSSGLKPPRDPHVYATVLARGMLPEAWARALTIPDPPLLHPHSTRELTRMLVRVGVGGRPPEELR